MVLVQVFRNGIRVHLNMWKLGRMPLEVDLEVPFRGEAAAADVAFKRSLTCVRSYVDLKRRVAAEHLAAIPATMLEERLPATASGL